MVEQTSQTKNSIRKQVDITREMLLGILANHTLLAAISAMVKALPAYIDDAERDFGLDIYDRMLKDPALSSSLLAIKVLVLSEGPRFLNRVQAPSMHKPDPGQEKKYQQGEEMRLFIERMCDGLQAPLEDILEEMLDFMPYGHKVAEKVYGAEGGKLVLKKLRVKPRGAYSFVVNQYVDFLGLVGAGAGRSTLVASDVKEEDIIPREKFFVLSYASRGGDPRGTSILRPAYNSWYLKQQTWPQYLKFLSQFGTPSIAGFLPPNSGEVELVDSQGNVLTDDEGCAVTKSAAEIMLQQLVNFQNGTAIVLDHDTKLDLIQSDGDGGAYIKAFDLYDRQMVRAVLIAVRATMEAEHGSKADSGTAQDIVSEFAQFIQRRVEVAFYRDVILPTIRYNFGDEAAEEMSPFMSLSDVAREDVVAMGNMIANLARADMIHPSQYPGIDAKLNLPERDYEAQTEEMQADRESARERDQMLKGLLPGTEG